MQIGNMHKVQNFYCSQIKNSSAKLAFFIPSFEWTVLFRMCNAVGHKLQQKFSSTVCGLGVLENNFIFHLMNDVIDRLLPSGIPQFVYDFHDWSVHKGANYKFVKTPKVMRIDDLEFGFLLWIISCASTVIVFLLEIIMEKFIKSIRTYFGALMFLDEFKIYLEINRH